jgi:hypothetical protein
MIDGRPEVHRRLKVLTGRTVPVAAASGSPVRLDATVTVYDMRVAVTDYFSAQSAERLVPDLDAAGTLRSAGIPDGYPFIVADNGTYEADLNRALRLMPSYGVRSLRSVRAYADVYVAAGRFLQGQPEPKTLWEATREDFNVLYNCRRVDLATRQSKATWNLWVAALDKLYRKRPLRGPPHAAFHRSRSFHVIIRRSNPWARRLIEGGKRCSCSSTAPT